jgi:hypothetical protein
MLTRRARLSRLTAGMLLLTGVVLTACEPQPGAYKVAQSNADGSAVRWNPCSPIRLVVNLAGAPSFTLAEVNRAVSAIESASGLDLVYAGTTSERPTARPTRDPARYGTGWSPILISFASATEFPFGSPAASGYGQAVPVVDSSGKRQYVTGQVVLRPGGWTEGVTSANPLSLMLRHELGHVLGLAHVSLTTEIMGTGGNGSARDWGTGDKEGLRVVGRPAGCLPLVP